MTANPMKRPSPSSTSVAPPGGEPPAEGQAPEGDHPQLIGARGEGRGAVASERVPTVGPSLLAVVTADRITNLEGSVKWFDPKKGFGFIVGPEGQDIFAHFTRIVGDGFRVLKDGSRVVYDAERTDKGWSATRVARVDDEAGPRRHYPRTPRR